MKYLFTIGHSKHSIEKFLGLLELHGVEVVADVRSHPMSRFNPQFNRKRLEAVLQEHDIQYIFRGKELGGRPPDEQFYDKQGFILYHRMAETPQFKLELKELLEQTKTQRVAIMCSEEDPNTCHRKLLIGKALFKNGEDLTLNHIRASGKIESEVTEVVQGVLEIPGLVENWKSPKPRST
jgi:uncharacterized protein (DUF488 family)